MRALEKIGLVLLSLALVAPIQAGQIRVQDLRTPLVLSATATEDGAYTVYHLKFTNISRESVRCFTVSQAGTRYHFRSFNPAFELPEIGVGKSHTFNVWVRGKVIPGIDLADIGVTGRYSQGSRFIYLSLPQGCYKRDH